MKDRFAVRCCVGDIPFGDTTVAEDSRCGSPRKDFKKDACRGQVRVYLYYKRLLWAPLLWREPFIVFSSVPCQRRSSAYINIKIRRKS